MSLSTGCALVVSIAVGWRVRVVSMWKVRDSLDKRVSRNFRIVQQTEKTTIENQNGAQKNKLKNADKLSARLKIKEHKE